MGDVIHDVESLELLRRGLLDILEDITGPRRSVFEFSMSEAGHGEAVYAILHFYDSWNDGRERVAESVRTNARNLESAISCYEEVEGALCSAFGSGMDVRVGAAEDS